MVSLKLSAQDKISKVIEIENANSDLISNKVSSVTFIKFTYKDKKRKILAKPGKKITTQFFDSLGRNIKEIHYNENNEEVSFWSKYYYADSIGRAMYRWETYNGKDSLIHLAVAKEEKGEMVYIIKDKGVSCFGNYNLFYSSNGLIQQAIWYGPKKGLWANEDMIPYYTVKLDYIFR